MILGVVKDKLRLVDALEEDDLYLSLSAEDEPCSGRCLHACYTLQSNV